VFVKGTAEAVVGRPKNVRNRIVASGSNAETWNDVTESIRIVYSPRVRFRSRDHYVTERTNFPGRRRSYDGRLVFCRIIPTALFDAPGPSACTGFRSRDSSSPRVPTASSVLTGGGFF